MKRPSGAKYTSLTGLSLGLCAAVLFGAVPAARALPFVESSAAIVPVFRSAVAWGDYDRDGDLDLVVTGLSGNGDVAKIYRNDGGLVFTDIAAPLAPVETGAACWVDYDRDGDLDLYLSGTFGSPPSALYRNDGALGFTNVGAGFHAVYQSSAVWGDVDNDGDLDLIQAGSPNGPDVAELYRNDGATFTQVPIAVPGFRRGSLDLADYDKDGDLDLLVSGINGPAFAAVYRNDGGTFTDVGAGLHALYDGRAAWGDFDNDGDFDILLDGSDATGSQVFTHLYRNDGGSFVDAAPSLPGAGEGSDLQWGDVDDDGDLDFAVIALNFGQSEVFRNDATTFVAAGAPLVDVCCGAIALGDADGDGDLDLFLSGLSSITATKLYRNQAATPNTAPAPPTSLASFVTGSDVMLSWGAGTDTETPAVALTYNLRVGTTPGGLNVVAPMAEPATGRLLTPSFGHVGANGSWPLRGLANGTYFWSVQSVDAGFLGSPFASEHSFTIGVASVPAPAGHQRFRVTQPFPSPLAGAGSLRFELGQPQRVSVDVFDLAGRRVAQLAHGVRPAGTHRVAWAAGALPPGLYLYRVSAGDESVTARVVVLGAGR